MISAFIGLVLSLVIIVFARITRFERDVSFYPTVLMVIALAFYAIAILGAYKSLTLVGLGIAAHGAYDVTHMLYLTNSVSPTWWPSFCAVIDMVLGFWVVYLSKRQPLQAKEHAI